MFNDDSRTRILNSAAAELDPVLSPHGDYVVFSSNREESNGGYDLYWARREGIGFSPPRPIGEGINTVFNERSPSLARTVRESMCTPSRSLWRDNQSQKLRNSCKLDGSGLVQPC